MWHFHCFFLEVRTKYFTNLTLLTSILRVQVYYLFYEQSYICLVNKNVGITVFLISWIQRRIRSPFLSIYKFCMCLLYVYNSCICTYVYVLYHLLLYVYIVCLQYLYEHICLQKLYTFFLQLLYVYKYYALKSKMKFPLGFQSLFANKIWSLISRRAFLTGAKLK